MEILHENSSFPDNVSLILGFFDGVHAGHQAVVKNTPNCKKAVVTFSSSPAEFFGEATNYIYLREKNYKLLEELGVNYIYEQKFSEIAHLSANEYLEKLLKKFNPVSITTGFNHTFGAKKQGNPEFLEQNKKDFQYYCTTPTIIDNEVVSSTLIKKMLSEGNIEQANKLLTKNFTLESIVIEGAKLGRKLGFPTANMKYPNQIVKIPYGVYKIRVLNKPAIMNWGIKPTFNAEELLEVHIPNFDGNLYEKNLQIEIISKIRNEQKFNNIEELKYQIEKDVKLCLE